jgi:peptidoglycan/xylan/chitin deacetylase (PgdA/CDA1 family)
MTSDQPAPGGVSRRNLLASIGVLAAASACSPAATTAEAIRVGSSSATASVTAPALPPGPHSSSTSSSPPPPAAPTAAPATSSASTSSVDGPAVEVVRGSGTRPQVALTFHGAGDPAIAQNVLDVLNSRQGHVTVMVVGTWLAANPSLAGVIASAGHELGNHTWTHPVLADLSEAGIQDEIVRCRDLLAQLTGSPGAFFRQSSAQHATDQILDIAGRSGYATCLSYDIDSTDWTDPGPQAIRQAVAAATAGSVVSLHFGHPGTVAALPGILDDLAARGLTPVTASALLAP